MGNCATVVPRSKKIVDGETDEESTSDLSERRSDVAVGGARPSVRRDNRKKCAHGTEQKRERPIVELPSRLTERRQGRIGMRSPVGKTPRTSSFGRAMPPVLESHKEMLRTCKSSLDELLEVETRNDNWNRRLNELIVDLESLKMKNVARLASDQARELLRRALTKGSVEDRRIGAYFDQLISMTAKTSTTISTPRTVLAMQMKERDLMEMRKSRFLDVPNLAPPTPGGGSLAVGRGQSSPLGSVNSPSRTQKKASWDSATIHPPPNCVECAECAKQDVETPAGAPIPKALESNDLHDHQSSEIAKDIEEAQRRMHGLDTSASNKLFLSSWITKYPGLKNISNWNFDIFGFDKNTQETPLSTLFMYSCSKMNVDTAIAGIDLIKLHRFMRKVEQSYGDNIYHNRLHASDVLHSAVNLMRAPYLCENLDVIHRFCLLFASAIHDFRHLGRGNDFLIKTEHQIAAIYNDSSCLENYHASQAFQLLRKPELNFLARVNQQDRLVIRKYTIHSILETDMKKHADHVKDLQMFLESRTDPSEPMLPLKLVSHCLHVCDLSHPTKRYGVHEEWTRRISEEFFRQGDEEEKMGWSPGALFDRKNVNIEKGQIGFIDFVVLPLWVNWTTVTDSFRELVDQIEANKDVWRTRMDAKKVKAKKKHRISVETPTRFFSRSSQDFSKSLDSSSGNLRPPNLSMASISSEVSAPRPPEVTVKLEPNSLVPARRPILRETSDVEQRSKSLSATLTASFLQNANAGHHPKRHTLGPLELPPAPTRPWTSISPPTHNTRKSITPPPPRPFDGGRFTKAKNRRASTPPPENKRASTPPPVVHKEDEDKTSRNNTNKSNSKSDASVLRLFEDQRPRGLPNLSSGPVYDGSISWEPNIRLIECDTVEPPITFPKRSRLLLSEVHSMSPSDHDRASPGKAFHKKTVVTLPRGSMTDALSGPSFESGQVDVTLPVFPLRPSGIKSVQLNALNENEHRESTDSDMTSEFKKTSPEESMTETPNAVAERLRYLRDQSLAETRSRPPSPGRKSLFL